MSKEATKATEPSRPAPARGIAGVHLPAAVSNPILDLQRSIGNRAVVGLIEAALGGDERSKHLSSTSSLSKSAIRIQRSPDGDGQAGDRRAPATGGLIVEDDAEATSGGQLRKGEFLRQLRPAVCHAADEAMAESGRDTKGCPYIEQVFSRYADKDPAYIEHALRKYAPETTRISDAREYIPLVALRVKRSVESWVRTGEISGVPDEFSSLFSASAGIAGAFSGIIGGIGKALSSAASAIGGFFSGVGRALFKKNDSAASSRSDPGSIQGQLVGGQPLDGAVRSKMGAALGQDFSHVRIHTGAQAAGLAHSLNARAFTVGSDIAFKAGEYQPGTLIGDALIAHELAHVAQQKDGVHTSGADHRYADSQSLETEADDAAVGAVLSVWAGGPTVRRAPARLLPGLKSGLRLQRCGGSYSDTDLKTYLGKLEAEGVQGGLHGDDKARAVVKQWKKSAKEFNLTPKLKALLIREMAEGPTGGDDERAMLDLLELSDNGDLFLMFTTEKLTPQLLDGEIDGDNFKELLAFYENRFVGGRAALARGRVEPKGSPAKGAPQFTYEWSSLDRRLLDKDLPTNCVAEYIRSLPPDQQAKALQDMNDQRAETQKKVDEIARLMDARVKKAAAKAKKKPGDLKFEEIFELGPNEMLAVQKGQLRIERIESVQYAFNLETARLGVKAAEAAVAPPKTDSEKDDAKAVLKEQTSEKDKSDFTDKAGYESELRAVIKKTLEDDYKTFVTDVNRDDRYDLDRLAQIANAGRDLVDAVFGGWAKGPEFVAGKNLIDRYEEVEQLFKEVPDKKKAETLTEIARSEVLRWMSAEKDVRAVHRKFKASLDDPAKDEAKIREKIADEFAKNDAQRIFEIKRGWPGGHREGKVKLQTTKQPAGPKERTHFWRLFQASIHEYIHSLMHEKYRTFAESFTGNDKSPQHNTLVEGVASVFHEMVWQSIRPRLGTPEVRLKVEGPDYAKLKWDESVLPDITRIRYASYEQAQAFIARVGINNVMLAFFKGRVDLIGG